MSDETERLERQIYDLRQDLIVAVRITNSSLTVLQNRIAKVEEENAKLVTRIASLESLVRAGPPANDYFHNEAQNCSTCLYWDHYRSTNGYSHCGLTCRWTNGNDICPGIRWQPRGVR